MATKNTHTDGPWYATGNHVQSVPLDEDNYVCIVEGRTHEEMLANAQLIASAPQMLDVLLRVQSFRGSVLSKEVLKDIDLIISRATHQKTPYEVRVEQLEKEGCTTSDAQGVADYEEDTGVLEVMIENHLKEFASSGSQQKGDATTSVAIADDKSTILVSRWDAMRYVGGRDPIGAYCVVKHLDNGSTSDYYFSFGGQGAEEGDDELEHDKFGIPDHEIYYFADDGEDEIKRLMEAPSDGCMNEFVILSYELRYQVLPKDVPSHAMEVTDHRAASGQLYVDVGVIEGDIDDILSATFELNGLTDDVQTQCMHLAFGHGDNAASFFKYNDSYLIRLEPGATLERKPSEQDGLVIYELK